MSDDVFNPWGTETSSGLLDDVDVTITDAYFGYDDQYNSGLSLLLKLEVTTNDEDHPEETIMLPVGKGWEPADKGQKARREDGRTDRNFHDNSGYAMWFKSAIECGAGDILAERGTATEAKVWKGLTFHVERKDVDYGGDIGVKQKLFVTGFEGGKASGGKAKASGKADAKPEASDEAPTTSSAAASIPGKLRVALMKLAKTSDTHDDFMEAAFGVDGVDGNAEAEALISDPDGFYAEVRG